MSQAFPSSPSLTNGDESAFELKLRLTLDLGTWVENWSRQRMLPDPHGDDGRYRTTSLYCDTSQFDVFHRTDGYRRNKYRVRRYGDMPIVFLERKTRQGDQVKKRRDSVTIDELPFLNGTTPGENWIGVWFLQKLRTRDLQPMCRVTYNRTAFVGEGPHAGLRLTLDRDLIGEPTNYWDLTPVQNGKPLVHDSVILELKFRDSLPALFRELLAELPPDLGRASKYRMCVRAWGLAGEEV